MSSNDNEGDSSAFSPTATSTASVKITAAVKWENMFQLLLVFKRSHGHTLVPNRHPRLGNWVGTQRRYYKVRKEGKRTSLTNERFERLNSIGFVWATKDPRHSTWEHRYNELVQYKETVGDCLVPVAYENTQLANWVSTQRQEWKKWRDGRESRLSDEKVQILQTLGFCFQAQRGGRRKRKSPVRNNDSDNNDSDNNNSSAPESPKKTRKTPFISKSINNTTSSTPWIKMFKEYVWSRDNQRTIETGSALDRWCHFQREQYAKSFLTQDQLNLLQSVAFDFGDERVELISRTPPPPESSLEARIITPTPILIRAIPVRRISQERIEVAKVLFSMSTS